MAKGPPKHIFCKVPVVKREQAPHRDGTGIIYPSLKDGELDPSQMILGKTSPHPKDGTGTADPSLKDWEPDSSQITLGKNLAALRLPHLREDTDFPDNSGNSPHGRIHFPDNYGKKPQRPQNGWGQFPKYRYFTVPLISAPYN